VRERLVEETQLSTLLPREDRRGALLAREEPRERPALERLALERLAERPLLELTLEPEREDERLALDEARERLW
jgi:hypothetical protein